MLEHLLLIVQEGNVEQNDLSELFSLGTGVFALILLVISLISYRKVKLTRLLFVSAAFALFALKTLIEHADLIFPGMDTSSIGGTLLVFLDFMILLLIFLSIARR
jgi:uncharacterized membrane protein YtjA (UPF0391 family)